MDYGYCILFYLMDFDGMVIEFIVDDLEVVLVVVEWQKNY